MSGGSRRGPPKHQNQYVWKPNAGKKINETEVGGKYRPLSEITGVCPRCKDQIEWKRRYGKYKPLAEPSKCQRCSKRAVRQAYHKLCHGCAKEQNVCAKCCSQVGQLIGRDSSELEEEQKMLEEAIKNARERDRRSLLRAMNKGKSDSGSDKEKSMIPKVSKVGELYPSTTLEEYNKSCKDRNGESDHLDDSDNSNSVGEFGDDNDEDDVEEDGHDDDVEEDGKAEEGVRATGSPGH
ncbi:hypothetical protein MLD38_001523 [Melastoma candidum]|uniref:Uncharacterized protein n=1 Tax=Melastoma candidum TaxID=119954 RepID=A0ACB9SET9_9MYRT|nr:hypothetical protein MLD38_001523 [Melastoma candidum]